MGTQWCNSFDYCHKNNWCYLQSMNSENYRIPMSMSSVDYADYYECRNSKEHMNVNMNIDDTYYIVSEGTNRVFTNCTFSTEKVGDLSCYGGVPYSSENETFIPRNTTNITFHSNNETLKYAVQVISREQGKTYQDCFDECVSQSWCLMMLSMNDGAQTFCQLMDVDYPKFKAITETHMNGTIIENFTATEVKELSVNL